MALRLEQVHSKLNEHWFPEEGRRWEKGENVHMQMSHQGRRVASAPAKASQGPVAYWLVADTDSCPLRASAVSLK